MVLEELGQLSAAEQDKFLEDLEQLSKADLPAAMEEQAKAWEQWEQAYAAAQAEQEEQANAQENLFADAQQSSDFSAEVVTFLVAAITSAAVTSLAIYMYRKATAPKEPSLYLPLSA